MRKRFERNTDEEEAAIQAGIAADPDNPEWTEAEFRAAQPAQFQPGTFGCHEALHVTNMMVEMLEQHLGNHPAILANPDWKKRADRATRELADLYQAIGAEHLNKVPDQEP